MSLSISVGIAELFPPILQRAKTPQKAHRKKDSTASPLPVLVPGSVI